MQFLLETVSTDDKFLDGSVFKTESERNFCFPHIPTLCAQLTRDQLAIAKFFVGLGVFAHAENGQL